MRDGSSLISGTTRFPLFEGQGRQAGRWEAIEPFPASGTWDGRVQFTDDVVTQVDLCEHSHDSQSEAEQCAQTLAARLNADLMSSGCPGDPTGRSPRRTRSRRSAFLRPAS